MYWRTLVPDKARSSAFGSYGENDQSFPNSYHDSSKVTYIHVSDKEQMTHASLHSAKKYFDARGLVRTSDKADIDDVESIQMAKPLHVSASTSSNDTS